MLAASHSYFRKGKAPKLFEDNLSSLDCFWENMSEKIFHSIKSTFIESHNVSFISLSVFSIPQMFPNSDQIEYDRL